MFTSPSLANFLRFSIDTVHHLIDGLFSSSALSASLLLVWFSLSDSFGIAGGSGFCFSFSESSDADVRKISGDADRPHFISLLGGDIRGLLPLLKSDVDDTDIPAAMGVTE